MLIVTSRMGSIEDNGSGGYYGYRASKAGVNAVGKSLALDLKPKGISVCLLHPGEGTLDVVMLVDLWVGSYAGVRCWRLVRLCEDGHDSEVVG